MTRKKSRPTHRENAADAPNEVGLYKMFWNSMETNPGTTGPNSPSPGNSAVIIINDSPTPSPCGVDDNSPENPPVPQPIKEENCDDVAESPHQNPPEEISQENQESRCLNSLQTCPPLTSPSKNSSPSQSNLTHTLQAENSSASPMQTSNEQASTVRLSTEELLTAADGNALALIEDHQVCTESTSENSEMLSDNITPVITTQSLLKIPTAGTLVSNEKIPLALPADNVSDFAASRGYESPNELNGISKEIPMEVISPPHSPGANSVSDETPPDEHEAQSVSNYDENPDVTTDLPDVGKTLSLLQSLLNAPDEELEALSELPGLIGHHESLDPNEDEEEMDAQEQDSSFQNHFDDSSMDIDRSTAVPENMAKSPDQRHLDNINQTVVDEDQFPTFNSSCLARKIKLDSIGVSRSIKLFKEQVRALYKEFLTDDVILQTVNEPRPPEEPSNEVEETPSFPLPSVFNICCVKMERLPEPLVKKSTIVMSDGPFKSWKKQIVRQRNEDKFRHLKVWRRGRTLLWRECELVGMDRATYDEQVLYIKKHKVNENSSSDESGDDEGLSDRCHSSNESSSEEETEDSELSSLNLTSSPMKPTSNTVASETLLPVDEYVVENTDQSTKTKASSALKITIRKASMNRSEDETTEGDSFTVPTLPSVQKTRKIATKRTFRRPNDAIPKASVPTKTAESKKSKPEEEDLYDQSLLGTRSHEVENFNLLEKWDIPFEAPTLFRSPRAASRLAQLKTKEAFAPSLKRHAPPKTSPLAVATTPSPVSKEVKDVVEMLCSKTVEAMLFPVTKSTKPDDEKPTKSEDAGEAFSNSLSIEESPLDESVDMSQSETNSTIDASSDFGGSTTSLLSEDLAPPKKSPTKPRRRRRGGGAWSKKKKAAAAKDKDKSIVEPNKGDIVDQLPENCMEQPIAEKIPQLNVELAPTICSAHSTQVPVVSEGPGQSPRDSEDDIHKVKEQIIETGLQEMPAEAEPPKKPHPIKTVEPVVSPRLTRSRLSAVDLNPGLLENVAARKRKRRTGGLEDASHSEDSQQIEPCDAMKSIPKIKVENIKPIVKQSTELVENDNSNTQVPEVSEGPGEEVLDQDKQEVEVQEPFVRVLRSRSRGPVTMSPTVQDSTTSNKKIDKPLEVEEDKTQVDELESPQSPPPETTEPDALISSRVTRSKNRRRLRPGLRYVPVRTEESALPSVCDIVDSIAAQRLPISKLFDAPANEPSPASEPITSFSVQSSTTPKNENPVDGKLPQIASSKSPNLDEKLPPEESPQVPNLSSSLDSSHSTSEPDAEPVENQTVVTLVPLTAAVENLSTPSSVESPSENVKPAEEVLDTLKSIIAVTSPKKTRSTVSAAPSPINSIPTVEAPSSVSSISAPPATVASQPAFPTQDMNSILPGTFLNSFFTSNLDAAFSNEINDSSLADDPGDLVIDETEGNEPDVSFWDNLTNADFSDDDNNTDLADKIDKIIKEQIHQDPVPVSTLKSKAAGANSSDGGKTQEESPSKGETDKSVSSLNRRDSIDERTGLPNNFLQRLRDPRIRSRLLSHLEEVETNDKAPQSGLAQVPGLAVLQNSLSVSDVTSSTVGGTQAPAVGRKADEVEVILPSISTVGSGAAPAGSVLVTQPEPLGTTIIAAVPGPFMAVNTPILGTSQQGTPIQDAPEVPPDPSNVDFLVPPSDDEDEEECIKRRPKKAKKEMDVELMYKSPLEDLQSEARPGYGERAPRRFSDNFRRRRSGDDRRSRIDNHRDSWPLRDHSRDRRFQDRGRDQSRDRRFEARGRDQSRDRRFERGRSQSRDRRFEDRGRSPSQDRRFEDRGESQSRELQFEDRGRDQSRDRRFERGRSQSRDRRFEDRGRSQSRDRRAFYDHPPRDVSCDRAAYEPHPWSVTDPAFFHHQEMLMQHPEPLHWQTNYQPEPSFAQLHWPEPPKIDHEETRLINLELLPKTTKLAMPPCKKIYQCFDKENVQMLQIASPTYDPKDQPQAIRTLDCVTEEIIEVIITPRPTSGLTKEYFRHVPPDLTMDDVVKFHFISPAYVMVHDEGEDSSSDEEEVEAEPQAKSTETLLVMTDITDPKKHLSTKLDSPSMPVGENLHQHDLLKQPNDPLPDIMLNPWEKILKNLPLLRDQCAALKSPPPPAPPPPEWNDVDLRMSHRLAEDEPLGRNPTLPKATQAGSRSSSPRQRSSSPQRRSRSPRQRSSSPVRRSRRSPSPSRRSPSPRRRSPSPFRRSRSPRRSSLSPLRRSRSPRRRSPPSPLRRSRSPRRRSPSPLRISKSPRRRSPPSPLRRSRSPRRRSPILRRMRRSTSSSSNSDRSISPAKSRSRKRSRSPRRRRSRSRSLNRSRFRRSSPSISPSRKHRR